jgi:type I restriction enzyme S subunit
MKANTSTQPLCDIATFEKGKPPAQMPHSGSDVRPYLTPDYLRGKATVEHVRPSPNAVCVEAGETIVLWDGSNAGEVFRAREGVLASTMMRVQHNADYVKEYFYASSKKFVGFNRFR